jgi:hypothetical protein
MLGQRARSFSSSPNAANRKKTEHTVGGAAAIP